MGTVSNEGAINAFEGSGSPNRTWVSNEGQISVEDGVIAMLAGER